MRGCQSDGEDAVLKRQRDSLDGAAGSLRCPITTALILDPVATADGHIYERSAIERWLATKDTSPNTGLSLEHKNLTAILAVRATIQHLVDGGSLPPAEVSDWLLRKGIAAAAAKEWAEAKRSLTAAFELGQAVAGYYLGRAWIDEAAQAKVPEAVTEVERRVAADTNQGQESNLVPISASSELSAGDIIRVLSAEQIALACDTSETDFEGADTLSDYADSTHTVLMVDSNDDTILLPCSVWLPVAACAKWRNAAPQPIVSPADLRTGDDRKIRLRDEATCRAAFDEAGMEHPPRDLVSGNNWKQLWDCQGFSWEAGRVTLHSSSAQHYGHRASGIVGWVFPLGAIEGKISMQAWEFME